MPPVARLGQNFVGAWIWLDFVGFRWISLDFVGFRLISLDFVVFRLKPHDLEMRALRIAAPKLFTPIWVRSARPPGNPTKSNEIQIPQVLVNHIENLGTQT